MDKRWLV